MQEAAYWKLRAKLSDATVLQMRAEALATEASRVSDAAWKEAGVELKPASKVKFNDENHEVEVG